MNYYSNDINNRIISENARNLIQGSWDLHIHTWPSHFERKTSDIELIREMDEVGMAGGIIKTHYEPTTGRAVLANEYAGGKAKLYGTVALNLTVGGINPFACESAFKMGARLIFMPTRDSKQHLSFGPSPDDFFEREGITIYDESGRIKPEVYDVLEVVRKYDAAIATGHLSPKESFDFCKLSRSMGIKTVLTHPDWVRTNVPLDMQIELASIGVKIEKVYQMVSMGYISPESYVNTMRKLGAENVVLSTDSAFVKEPSVTEANLLQIQLLLDSGFRDSEIRMMSKVNSEYLLGI